MATEDGAAEEPSDDRSGVTPVLEAARRGQKDALGRLLQVASIYCRLYAIDEMPRNLASKVGISDVGQMTAIDVMMGVESFRGNSRQFYGWLRRIVRNNVIDLQRKHRWAASKEVGIEVDPPAPPGDDPIEAQDSLRRVREVLGRLPEDRARVIHLRVMERLGWNEVGARMGRSGGAAQHLFARALVDARIELCKAGLVSPPDGTR